MMMTLSGLPAVEAWIGVACRKMADAGGEADATSDHGGDGPDDATAAADLPEEGEGDDGERAAG